MEELSTQMEIIQQKLTTINERQEAMFSMISDMHSQFIFQGYQPLEQ